MVGGVESGVEVMEKGVGGKVAPTVEQPTGHAVAELDPGLGVKVTVKVKDEASSTYNLTNLDELSLTSTRIKQTSKDYRTLQVGPLTQHFLSYWFQ